MTPIQRSLVRLTALPVWGYEALVGAAEPTAAVACALAAHGEQAAAQRAGHWLANQQSSTGAVGVSERQSSPHWATAWALLAWRLAPAPAEFLAQREQAVRFLLSVEGDRTPRQEEVDHDTTLAGWPWVAGTHAWLEPTALSVIALQAVGLAEHPRVREGERLLLDRILPDGGCNYGNTCVLGQTLRPHLQPTGLALWALARNHREHPRVIRSHQWLAANLTATTSSMSLGFGLLGLSSVEALPSAALHWAEQGLERILARDGQPLSLALLLMVLGNSVAPLGKDGAPPPNLERQVEPNPPQEGV